MRIAVIGAGIMGLTVAWWLRQRADKEGLSIALDIFEKDPCDERKAAAYTAAGMLAPYAELASSQDEVYRLGMRSLEHWPSLVTQLEQCSSYAVDFCNTGTVVVAHQQDKSDLINFNRQLHAKLGKGTSEHLQILSRAQIQQKLPGAFNFESACFLPFESWIDSRRCMFALEKALRLHGVNFHWQQNIDTQDSQFIEQFEWIVDCRGLGAREALPSLRGVRGEIITVRAPEVSIRHMVRIMHPRYRLYVVPRRDQHYVVGATQLESDCQDAITVRSTLELLSALYSLHPGFAEANVMHIDANCRPAFPNNAPSLELSGKILSINGLFRHGYLLAPALAEQACEQLF